jgi:hypothetical protein
VETVLLNFRFQFSVKFAQNNTTEIVATVIYATAFRHVSEIPTVYFARSAWTLSVVYAPNMC